MVGLQGSGKTTTTAKIAKRLKERDKKKVLMASLDVRRPAAQEQLRHPRRADRRRHAAHRQGRGPRRCHRQARHEARPARRL
jgi:signal recognition particle GTPase